MTVTLRKVGIILFFEVVLFLVKTAEHDLKKAYFFNFFKSQGCAATLKKHDLEVLLICALFPRSSKLQSKQRSLKTRITRKNRPFQNRLICFYYFTKCWALSGWSLYVCLSESPVEVIPFEVIYPPILKRVKSMHASAARRQSLNEIRWQ